MPAQIPVKFYNNNQQGSPVLGNANGDLTALLDAVLVNGFNLKGVTSITASGGIATATIGAGHQYQNEQVLALSGANEPAFVGEFRAMNVTSNTFQFVVPSNAPASATGTLQAKVAPLGWEIAFTATNKRVYRSTDPSSPKNMLRVDDSLDPAYNASYAKKGKVTLVQANGMTGIDTFTGSQAPFNPGAPTMNHVATGSGASVVDGWYKWYYSQLQATTSAQNDTTGTNAGPRAWALIGDSRGFFLFNDAGGYGKEGKCFTDINSFRSGDQFATLLCANNFNYAANYSASTISNYQYATDFGAQFAYALRATGKLLLRSHTQVGAPVSAQFVPLGTQAANFVSGFNTNVPAVNPLNLSLVLSPVYLQQGNDSSLRGVVPGLFWVCNNIGTTMLDGDIVTNVSGYPGRKFMLVRTTATGATSVDSSQLNNCWMAFDITGPWW